MPIYLPQDAAHAERFRASGLTRYSYEEILAAAAEVQQAEAAFTALLCGPINTLLQPYETTPDGHSLIVRVYPAHLGPLADLAYEGQQKISIPTNGRADYWPVRQWQQQAKTYRAWIKRLERAIEKAQESATLDQSGERQP